MGFGSYVAACAEVSVNAGGELRVHRDREIFKRLLAGFANAQFGAADAGIEYRIRNEFGRGCINVFRDNEISDASY
jgi:hypothetical protein